MAIIFLQVGRIYWKMLDIRMLVAYLTKKLFSCQSAELKIQFQDP